MIPLKFILCCCISAVLFLLRSGCGARPLPAGTSEFAKDHHQSSRRAAANLKVMSPEAAKNLKKGGEMSFQIGSRPPSCFNKCNSCFPCQAVQVPTPLNHKLASQGPLPSLAAASSSKSASFSAPPLAESSSSSFSARPSSSASASPGQICSEYSNYKPEGWKCKCGNKLFNP